jgi:hypothetical protein
MAESLSDADYAATPEGSAQRWRAEFKAAREALKGWHDSAEECDRKYRDDVAREGQRLGLYAAGVDLKEATLYGNAPNADVERRDSDQDDDVARVAAELLERVLNNDLERTEEGAPAAYGLALKDWLIPGMGNVWHRLERKTEKVDAVDPIVGPDGQEQAPAVPATSQTVSEEVPTEYKYWKDQLWSPCRVFPECRWFAYRALLSKKTIAKKFGEQNVPLSIGADAADKTVPKTPWARAEVWEIWDKENACVWWFVEDHPRVLTPIGDDGQPLPHNPDGSISDPLEISGFWPFPEPLFEGLTNSKLVPRPSYARAQDQYNAIDDETTRIGLLRDAIDASGIYDKTVGELGDILNSRGENRMVPAANYKALAEKGGIAASVMWKPLEAIVGAMTVLRDLRREDIDLLFQVDGTSDIMRGQATEGGATATEQAIKAKYGSIRGGKAQKRFAAFVADAQRIRGEIICKHFDPQTIAERANAQGLPQPDQMLVPQAIALLKSDFGRFRISVKSESVSLTDFAANKQEAIDVVGMIGQFMEAVGPLVQGMPQLGPLMLQLLTAFVARVKGGDAAEPILDQMVKMVEQAAQQQAMAAQQPKPPDPKVQQEQVKLQTEGVKAGAEQFRARADVAQTQMEITQAAAEHAQTMQQLEGQVRADAMKTFERGGA